MRRVALASAVLLSVVMGCAGKGGGTDCTDTCHHALSMCLNGVCDPGDSLTALSAINNCITFSGAPCATQCAHFWDTDACVAKADCQTCMSAHCATAISDCNAK